MKKINLFQRIVYFLCIAIMTGVLTACTAVDNQVKNIGTSSAAKGTVQNDATESVSALTGDGEETESDGRRYLVVANNREEGTIRLYDYFDRQIYQYRFASSTSFLDKYGSLTTSASMAIGKLVAIGNLDENGYLMKVQLSDETWEYPDVVRFSVDEENRIFQIAGTKYTWQDDLMIFDGEEQIKLSDLKSSDTLNIVGIGKQILSVVVTAGDGTLKLENTGLFEGSYVQVGKHIIKLITEDMTLTVPEGSYELAVANNGWGGTKEITIARGEVTTVDLDEIKGEGPSYGKIAFEVDVEDAEIYIDGEKIDKNKVISLQYGAHSLQVTSGEYDTWSRTLYVNSEEATIVISLEETAEQEEEEEENSSSSSESKTSSQTNSTTSSSESSSEEIDDDYLKEYLSTLSSILDTIH